MCLNLSCGGSSNSEADPGAAFDRNAMLLHLGNEVIVPALQALDDRAASLLDATAAYQAAVQNGGDVQAAHAAAQAAWKQSMLALQELEPMQVGPAGSSAAGGAKGGMDLRDELYSWPTVSGCRVDQELITQGFQVADFFEQELVNVYGLDALEYLLFVDSADHSCASQTGIDADWDALSEDELLLRRASYAATAAAYFKKTTSKLLTLWQSDGGNFIAAFTEPGIGDSPYDDERCAVDEVFAALYHLELGLKDQKLGVPAGIRVECSKDVCPELVESVWAKHSKENIGANLKGFEALFFGKEGLGFDDFLVELGAQSLATELRNQFDAILAAYAQIQGTLSEALVLELDQVVALHTAVKNFMDIVKSQVVSVLGLRVPLEADGDND
ncbi:MAG: imelysin family protein [Myxococcales bacterium]|nr:MAG: imelysin family protein [Myxococcales bacterium]